MTPLVLIFAALIGLCVGSFCATFAVRSVRGEQAMAGRSHCDHCGRTLSLVETVPVLGYAMTLGRCRTCRGPIDPDHLAGELAGAVICVATFAFVPPTKVVFVLVIGFALLTSALIDRRTQRLPDALTLLIGVAGAAATSLDGPDVFKVHLLVAFIAFCLLMLVRTLSRARSDAHGLGFGDVKLVGALALWLGLATPWMIALASVLGLMTLFALRAWRERLAFGPMLAVSAMVLGIAMEAGLDLAGGSILVR